MQIIRADINIKAGRLIPGALPRVRIEEWKRVVTVHKAYKMPRDYEATFPIQNDSMRFSRVLIAARQAFTLSCSWLSDTELHTKIWRLHLLHLSS